MHIVQQFDLLNGNSLLQENRSQIKNKSCDDKNKNPFSVGLNVAALEKKQKQRLREVKKKTIKEGNPIAVSLVLLCFGHGRGEKTEKVQ